MTENNYACKDNLWAHCGALGDALRRASEAERKVEELLAKAKELEDAKPAWWQEALGGDYPGKGSFTFDEDEG